MSQYTAPTTQVDGDLDPTFNGDGKKVLVFPNAKSTSGQCIVEGPDDKVYVGGSVNTLGDIQNLGVARLHKDGTSDVEFGDNGYKIVLFGPMQNAQLRQILFLNVNGELRILLSGIDTIKGDVVLARLHLDGRVDERFGVKGLLTVKPPVNLAKSLGLGATPLTTTSNGASGPCTVADGKIYVVMEMYMPIWIATVAVLIRLNDDGSFDTTFNKTGYVAVTNQYWGNSTINDVLVHNGKITVCGTLADKGMVARLNEDGTFDEGFADKAFSLHAESELTFEKLAPYGAEEVLAAGWGLSPRKGALARFTKYGQLDPTFNRGELLFQSFEAGSNVLFDGVGQFNGKTIVAGRMGPTGGDPSFVVARHLSNGTLDTDFGHGKGWSSAKFAGYYTVANAMALQKNGKVLVVGTGGKAALIARFLNTTTSR